MRKFSRILKYVHGRTLLLLLAACALPARGQKADGTPFIRNYSPKEYRNSPDNWAIAQDKRGVMYIGNASAVLEYDGVKWRSIPVSNSSLVRSIAIDSNGIIYVGAVGEFGMLQPDDSGCLAYKSLVSLLPEEEREFADVWKTYATPEGVYFQTFTKLIRVADGKVKIWKPKTSFHFSYFVNGQLFVIEREAGLKTLRGETLSLVPQGELFAGYRIYSMLPYHGDRILIATREKGLYLMDAKTDSVFAPLASEVNISLIDDQVYGGVELESGRYAYATLKNGIFIVNAQGAIIQALNKKTGLQDDIVKCVSTDNQHDLWAGLGTGISRIEISSPLTTLGDAHGISGFVQDIAHFGPDLYVATSLGLFAGRYGSFQPAAGINSQTWSVEKIAVAADTMILACSDAGIYAVGPKGAKLIQAGSGYFIYQSKKNPARVYVGMSDGVISLRYENNRWENEDYLPAIEEEIRSIAESDDGTLWLGTPFNGVVSIRFLPPEAADTLLTSWNEACHISRFTPEDGLPDLKYNIPYNVDQQILFATLEGFYQFNKGTSRFETAGFLHERLARHQVYRFAAREAGEKWLFTIAPDGTKETGTARFKNGRYEWYMQPFMKIADREIHAIFPDQGGVTWLGGPDGLLHYDAHVNKNFSEPFNALIRLVVSVRPDRRDSIFGGTYYEVGGAGKKPVLRQAEALTPAIDYEGNSVLFEYAAASYGDEKNNLYSIFLEGYDKDWSKWSSRTEKEYTNLREGQYTFRVKAKNIYGKESAEASYAFTILPPWYRTVWAYIVYVVAFTGFVILVIRLSVRRLVKAKIRLEGIVKERTAEIEHQKAIVEHKNKDIMDSINYAQRIQRALLAGDKLLKENLPESFVLFQPKDIVSGDFYWGAVLANKQFALVTADSTGHGVPGAIMSMLNISCLNEAVDGQRLVSPDDILNYTRKKIIQHLSNDGSAEGGKDGMDCALTCYDLNRMQLSYAGANNPLWIVRDKQILEFDPDKMPVGKHDKDNIPFVKHRIDLQRGDMIYTSTDGMPDQFGGPKGKKFMYKKLKELLISISHLSVTEQKNLIGKTLNDWKGELEQVDDVCIIGVRV